MRRYWLSVAALALALGLVASSALVQERGGGADRPRRGAAQGGARRGMMFSRGGTSSVYLPDLTSRIPGLTDAQRKQIASIREAAIAKIREIQKKMNDDIKRQVLNPEQITLMEQAERRITHRGPGGVILTDEQLAKYNALRAEVAKIQDPEARREAYRKMSEDMQATYTEEQKKQAADMRARFTRQRGGRTRGGAGGGQGER
jgi:hypothetical protein